MNAYFKNIFRTMAQSKSRFLSILIISALGVAFFAGIRAASPNMKESADQYLREQNAFDIKVMSPTGLTKEDAEKIEEIANVRNVYPSYTVDAYAQIGDERKAVRLHSLEEVNQVVLLDGRLPENSDEVVAEDRYLSKNNLEIGDKVTLSTTLATKEMTIVGTISNPLYMNRSQRGPNTLGTGTTEAFFFADSDVVKQMAVPDIPGMPSVFTEIYVTIDNPNNENMYSDRYKDLIRPIKRKIEQLNDDWIVLDRTSNVGMVTFGEDAEKIAAIGDTFPLIFFLVATMVCLTAMTRMVEEQRIQIGTFKALGYGKMAIVFHYLIYAFLASALGSIIGVWIGMPLFPSIIFNAYSAMYDLPKFITAYHPDLILTSAAVAIFCTLLATVLACIKELHSVPAELMRPKPPKMGKRILLERIPFFWNRLSFIGKITMRNLFRYKKRFLMTIFGIAACTGLILTGFGLLTSVNSITDLQYGKIFLYNISGTLAGNLTEEQADEKREVLQENEHVADTLMTFNMNSTITSENAQGQSQRAYVLVPESKQEINHFIHLYNDTNAYLTLSDDGVILTRKLAKMMKVEPGDTIHINLNNTTVQAKVAGVTNHYVLHYVYMSKAYYEKLFDETVMYNSFLSFLEHMKDTTEDEVAQQLIAHDGVSQVNFSSVATYTLTQSMDTFGIVVVVLIVSAGLLAFVVMYNLTSININERQREIATIKVLGFYDGEVASYIYRENILLSIIGTVVGLFFGVFMTNYVLTTAEPDTILFPGIISPLDFTVAAVLTLIFAGIVNLVMYKTLKDIDMIESLKSAE